MSSFFLKIFALFFMIFDHIGFVLFPDQIIFRLLGRLSFPLFAYQMAVGFSHTKNKKNHIIKLLIFAIFCQIPFSLATHLYSTTNSLNIIFTFVIALLIIYTLENFPFLHYDSNLKKYNFTTKNFLISLLISGLLLFIGILVKTDYEWYGILLTVSFYFTLKKKILSLILFFLLVNLNFIINKTVFSLLSYVSLFDCIFILLFNGKKGYKSSTLFYILYFIHLFPILLIKSIL